MPGTCSTRPARERRRVLRTALGRPATGYLEYSSRQRREWQAAHEQITMGARPISPALRDRGMSSWRNRRSVQQVAQHRGKIGDHLTRATQLAERGPDSAVSPLPRPSRRLCKGSSLARADPQWSSSRRARRASEQGRGGGARVSLPVVLRQRGGVEAWFHEPNRSGADESGSGSNLQGGGVARIRRALRARHVAA